MMWTIRDTARVCNFIKNVIWAMCFTLVHGHFHFHTNTLYRSIPSPQYSELNKSRSVFGLFCHQNNFFWEVKGRHLWYMEPSELGGIWEMQQYRLLQQSSAASVSLLQPSLRSRNILWELSQQLRVNHLHISNPRILHYLHVTMMEFFICWESLSWLKRVLCIGFFSNGKFWLILSISVM